MTLPSEHVIRDLLACPCVPGLGFEARFLCGEGTSVVNSPHLLYCVCAPVTKVGKENDVLKK